MTETGPSPLAPGQFRLTRLQMVNWGTFQGRKNVAIDDRGVLFTGASGAGKSSVLDAQSVVLLPHHDQRFNASADLTARGAKQGARSLADYVRGAWDEFQDEHGAFHIRYLRGGKPTWSAVAGTFDDRLGSVSTAVVLLWFTGTETDGGSLRPRFLIYDRDFDLLDLNAWAEARFDPAQLERTGPIHSSKDRTRYTRVLRRRIGLGTSEAALALLGKAKAMKSPGDLNLFIREHMLDLPASTFATADTMVKAFTPLNEAYETASCAREQQRTLQLVPQRWEQYLRSGEEYALVQRLRGVPAEHYLRGVQLRAVRTELGALEGRLQQLQAQLADQESAAGAAEAAYLSLVEQLKREGGMLRELEVRLEGARTLQAHRHEAYGIYQGHLSVLGLDGPRDEQAFTAIGDKVAALLDSAQAEQDDITPRLRTAHAQAGNAAERHQARLQELQSLKAATSLIPGKDMVRRRFIARGAGVAAAELAYAAELIDVAAGQERWRPAAEKVLRDYGLKLLVPQEHAQAVTRFIDEKNMRGLVDYSVVPAATADPPHPDPTPAPGTLAGKLTVDLHHPSGAWLAGQLADHFPHVCVERARDLEPHHLAVTVHGTVKAGDNHYRKDDRPEVANPSSYILGADIAAKRAALEAEVAELEAAARQAAAAADQLQQRADQIRAALQAATHVTGYTRWDTVDHWSPAQTAAGLEERIRQLKDTNVSLRELERQRDRAHATWTRLTDRCAATRAAIDQAQQRRRTLTTLHDREQAHPHVVSQDTDRRYLDQVLNSLTIAVTVDHMAAVAQMFRKELDGRLKAAEASRDIAAADIQTAIDRFLDRWPDAAPDNSGDLEKSGADFAALHADITQRRLPEAMQHLQRMISQDMVPSVAFLQRAIEEAVAEVKQRIAVVNTSLKLVQFAEGTYLQIAPAFTHFEEAREFRAQVDALLSNEPRTRTDPQAVIDQFHRVRALMARFTAQDTSSQHWKTRILDIRQAFTFTGQEKLPDGSTIRIHRKTGSKSGGEQEKLVAFCLAAALTYNLADPDPDPGAEAGLAGRPRFAMLMLDEAFSKTDEIYAAQALSAFAQFGFQLVVAAPIRTSGILEPFIGQVIHVSKQETPDSVRSNLVPSTLGELAIHRAAHAIDPGADDA
ncbi:ATP-binding protein [Actinomadura viridis]|uniref:ATP-binding protein n=1 Tax=Actinomadura viridis TaxID=58110 RepID=UPI0036AE7243